LKGELLVLLLVWRLLVMVWLQVLLLCWHYVLLMRSCLRILMGNALVLLSLVIRVLQAGFSEEGPLMHPSVLHVISCKPDLFTCM
jgi:hypothetical protein